MLYNNNGYTIEISDELYWTMTDDEFNEYINTTFISRFNANENTISEIQSSAFIAFPDENDLE